MAWIVHRLQFCNKGFFWVLQLYNLKYLLTAISNQLFEITKLFLTVAFRPLGPSFAFK